MYVIRYAFHSLYHVFQEENNNADLDMEEVIAEKKTVDSHIATVKSVADPDVTENADVLPVKRKTSVTNSDATKMSDATASSKDGD